jgi:hypothetical protein
VPSRSTILTLRRRKKVRTFGRLAAAGPILRALRMATLAAVCAAATTGARAAPYNTSGLPPASVARITKLCRNVIRLSPEQGLFASCVESLSATLQGQAPLSADGIQPVELHLQADHAGAQTPDPGVGLRRDDGSSKSYFYASREEIRRREKASCASLGLDQRSLDACATDLQTTFFSFENPIN